MVDELILAGIVLSFGIILAIVIPAYNVPTSAYFVISLAILTITVVYLFKQRLENIVLEFISNYIAGVAGGFSILLISLSLQSDNQGITDFSMFTGAMIFSLSFFIFLYTSIKKISEKRNNQR
ncbi:hypothetical protein [Geoglobus ahangari]